MLERFGFVLFSQKDCRKVCDIALPLYPCAMLRRKGSIIVRNGKPVATVITRGPTRKSTFISTEELDASQRVLWTNKDAHGTGVEDRCVSLGMSTLRTQVAGVFEFKVHREPF